MRKISINVSDEVAAQLDIWAEQTGGRSLSQLCQFLVEKGLAEAEVQGVVPLRGRRGPSAEGQPGAD